MLQRVRQSGLVTPLSERSCGLSIGLGILSCIPREHRDETGGGSADPVTRLGHAHKVR